MKLRFRIAFSLLGVGLLGGCASDRVEEDFGRSVRLMISEQSANPAPRPNQKPAGMDGPKAEAVLDIYRTYSGQPAAVEAPIEINIGGADQ